MNHASPQRPHFSRIGCLLRYKYCELNAQGKKSPGKNGKNELAAHNWGPGLQGPTQAAEYSFGPG